MNRIGIINLDEKDIRRIIGDEFMVDPENVKLYIDSIDVENRQARISAEVVEEEI